SKNVLCEIEENQSEASGKFLRCASQPAFGLMQRSFASRRMTGLSWSSTLRQLRFLRSRIHIIRISPAARTRRNQRAVRAGTGMSQERADLLGRFLREDVLELAGLLLDFRLAVHGQAVGEQSFGQAMATNDVSGALASARREFDNH